MTQQFEQITSPPQAQAEVLVNESLEALQHVAVYGYRVATSTALTWGYYGGSWNGFSPAAGMLALTASATNYIVVARATGVISVSTSSSNHSDTTNYARAYTVITGVSTVTTAADERLAPSGLLAGSGSGGSFTGGTLTGALNEAPQVTLASAATVNIGAVGANSVTISGTTTITAFDAIASGAVRRLVFQGALTFTHNATSLILPGAANITTAAGDVAWMESRGAGNWRCVGYHKASGAAVVSSGGGLTNITEALATSSPNNTNNVVSLTITGGSTNAFLALSPKANGGLLAQVPDGTTTGGNVRGVKAVDWQQGRTVNDKVAAATGAVIGGGDSNKIPTTGAYGVIAGGQGNTAGGSGGTHNTVGGGSSNAISASAGNNTIGGGSGNIISTSAGGATIGGGASNAITGIGATIPGGETNSAAGNYAFSIGTTAVGKAVTGVYTHSAGALQTNGDAQNERYIMGFRTLNATPAPLTTTRGAASAANQPVLASGSAMSFIGHVIARNTTTGDIAAWYVSGTIKNVGGTASLVGTPTVAALGADAGASSWTLAVTADNTNKCLQITGTGAAATTIKWLATVDVSYVV
jgi:hypothetical protein